MRQHDPIDGESGRRRRRRVQHVRPGVELDRVAHLGVDRPCRRTTSIGGRGERQTDRLPVDLEEIGRAVGDELTDRDDRRGHAVEGDLGDRRGKDDGLTESAIDGRPFVGGDDLERRIGERQRTREVDGRRSTGGHVDVERTCRVADAQRVIDENVPSGCVSVIVDAAPSSRTFTAAPIGDPNEVIQLVAGVAVEGGRAARREVPR